MAPRCQIHSNRETGRNKIVVTSMEGERVPLVASRERVSSFVDVGWLIQAAGLLAPFVLAGVFGAAAGGAGAAVGGLVGLVLLVVLFVVGSRKASLWRCGVCKNPIANKDVRICPVCRLRFVRDTDVT
jgi:hypothetical protein